MTGFRPFFNPATGEWIQYTVTAGQSDGQLVRFTWRSVPGGVIELRTPPLWALAKVFGVRPYYERWDSQITEAGRQCDRRPGFFLSRGGARR